MKNSNDTIGNQTRDRATCSAVPQPTALPHAPAISSVLVENKALLAQTLGIYAITALIGYAVTYFYISEKG